MNTDMPRPLRKSPDDDGEHAAVVGYLQVALRDPALVAPLAAPGNGTPGERVPELGAASALLDGEGLEAVPTAVLTAAQDHWLQESSRLDGHKAAEADEHRRALEHALRRRRA